EYAVKWKERKGMGDGQSDERRLTSQEENFMRRTDEFLTEKENRYSIANSRYRDNLRKTLELSTQRFPPTPPSSHSSPVLPSPSTSFAREVVDEGDQATGMDDPLHERSDEAYTGGKAMDDDDTDDAPCFSKTIE
ncbi:hypothetical protein PMAYCL1PPCAC_00698, partial [Pristionchus mayeri]